MNAVSVTLAQIVSLYKNNFFFGRGSLFNMYIELITMLQKNIRVLHFKFHRYISFEIKRIKRISVKLCRSSVGLKISPNFICWTQNRYEFHLLDSKSVGISSVGLKISPNLICWAQNRSKFHPLDSKSVGISYVGLKISPNSINFIFNPKFA
jgi:hypothetical protein